MKKEERKQAYREILHLMLKGENKNAFDKLACLCGEDTGLFIIADYQESVDAAQKTKLDLEHLK